MPVTKGAAKALRSSRRKRAANLLTIKKYRRAVKVTRDSIAQGKKDEATKLLPAAFRQLDKAAKKNVIHKNKASRLKSRLTTGITRLK